MDDVRDRPERRANALQGCNHVGRAHHAAARVARVGNVRETADDGEPPWFPCLPRQRGVAVHRLVLQEHDGLLRGLPGKRPVFFRGNQVLRIPLRLTDALEAQPLPYRTQRGVVDDLDGHLAPLYEVGQEPGVEVAEGHLHVQPREGPGFRVAQPEDEVGDHVALETPLVFEDLGEQPPVLTAELAVDLVVGAHHRSRALLDAALEVRQVHLAERPLGDAHVHPKTRVLYAVEREVLDTGHRVPLHAAHQGGAHLAEVVRILTVGLLGPPPGWVPQEVDAHAPEEVGALGTQLDAYDVADPLLQLWIPGSSAGHGDWE